MTRSVGLPESAAKAGAVQTLRDIGRSRSIPGFWVAAFLALAPAATAIVPWTIRINPNNVIVVTNAAGDNATDNTRARAVNLEPRDENHRAAGTPAA